MTNDKKGLDAFFFESLLSIISLTLTSKTYQKRDPRLFTFWLKRNGENDDKYKCVKKVDNFVIVALLS